MDIRLTKEQKRVADAIIDFSLGFTDGRYLAVSGYAGTGKTTVMGYAAAELLHINPSMAIAFCAPTGKAASVLHSKLQEFGAMNRFSKVHTIHGHIYKLKGINNNYEFDWERRSEKLPYDLFVVDEASMVTEQMFRDLMAYKLPVVFIGDSGQLPPVNSKPFKALSTTPLKLTTVHRQALMNPIIAVATDVREGKKIPFGPIGKTFVKVPRRSEVFSNIRENFAKRYLDTNTMILCGINRTRVGINASMRSMLGFKGVLPMEGEHMICLRNEREFNMFNGQKYTVLEQYGFLDDECTCYKVKLSNNMVLIAYSGALNTTSKEIGPKLYEDSSKIFRCLKQNSIQDEALLLDYGYACSVHKAQGSEWDNVLLYDERTQYMDDAEYTKWLYTGITRAKEKLCIAA